MSVDTIYYRDAGSLAGARSISARARAAMYSLFVRKLLPNSSTTVLDLGVSDEEGPETNMLERQYPWPENIVCAGLGNALELRARYPKLAYVKIGSEHRLPFRDKAFDITCSNAVLEHVGGRSQRAKFLGELIRVSRAIFITVPNRWFPIEHHTGIPFLHWNIQLFRLILLRTELRYWVQSNNMELLDKKMLIEEWPSAAPAEVLHTGLRLGPFSSNLALIATDV